MEMGRKKKKEKTEIPPEIIVDEIMWRLPVKALARFRSVCKTWNSMIASDPNFAILQLKNSSATACDRQRVLLWNSLDICSALFQEKNNDNSEFAFKRINTSPIKVKGSYRCHLIVASCDGLVCIFDQVYNSLLFWNPLTGETKRVSVPPSGIPPLSPHCSYGLGYDSSTDDYKLVWIKHGIFDNVAGLRKPDEVGVFSLRTNSWRQIQDSTIMLRSMAQGLSINGALYWAQFSVDLLHRHCVEVASFCLEKEKYRLLNIPLNDLRVCRGGVQALGDKLAVYYESNVSGSYRLLLMNPCENSASWTEHTVTLRNGDWFTPLCLLENVEEVLLKVNGHRLDGGHLGIYRFSDGTFRHLQAPRAFHTMTFSESLISPNTYKGMKN